MEKGDKEINYTRKENGRMRQESVKTNEDIRKIF